MAEEVNLKDLVAKVADGYSLVERILLTTDGTVVSLLSVIFGEPVTVRVVDQARMKDHITRLVDLETRNLVVARARSTIPLEKNSAQVLEMVEARDIGLGHIAQALGIKTARTLDAVGRDGNECCWRTYRMEGEGLFYAITEWFPRGIYNGLAAAWKVPGA